MEKVRRERGRPGPCQFRNSPLLQSTILNQVLQHKSPGEQTSNSLQIRASQSSPVLSATRRHSKPRREASVRVLRGCLREAPIPRSVSVGVCVGRGLGETEPMGQRLCLSRPVLPLPRPPSTQGPAHLQTSPFTDHPSTAGALSVGGPPMLDLCLLSYSLHFLSLFLILIDNSLN